MDTHQSPYAGRTATLRRDHYAVTGIYSAGLQVRIIDIHDDTALVCLDNGFHPIDVCHTARLPKRMYFVNTQPKERK